MQCTFCEKDNKSFVIKEYVYWTLIMHKNQSYPGRCLVVLNRHTEDLFDVDKNEARELYTIGKHTRDAISEVFHPNLFNYGSLGNFVSHVHMHIIPRYAKPVVFNEREFVDKKWGDFYYPYDKHFHLPDDMLKSIYDTLKKEIDKK